VVAELRIPQARSAMRDSALLKSDIIGV